jgi:hypothetical protein
MHTRPYVYPLNDFRRMSGIVISSLGSKTDVSCTYTKNASCIQQRHLGKGTASLTLGSQCEHGITGLVWW